MTNPDLLKLADDLYRYSETKAEQRWQVGYLTAIEFALQLILSFESREDGIKALNAQINGMRLITKTERITEESP